MTPRQKFVEAMGTILADAHSGERPSDADIRAACEAFADAICNQHPDVHDHELERAAILKEVFDE